MFVHLLPDTIKAAIDATSPSLTILFRRQGFHGIRLTLAEDELRRGDEHLKKLLKPIVEALDPFEADLAEMKAEEVEVAPDRLVFLTWAELRGKDCEHERRILKDRIASIREDGAAEIRVTQAKDGCWIEAWERKLQWPEIQKRDAGAYVLKEAVTKLRHSP